MKPPKQKPTGAQGIQQFKHQLVHTPQHRAAVLQSKQAVPKHRQPPVAPPVYRPQPVPKVLQTKQQPSSSAQGKTKLTSNNPPAPPVYRPQPLPRVLQTKTAQKQVGSIQFKTKAAPPAVYKPQPVPKVLQRKQAENRPARESAIQRTTPAAPRHVRLSKTASSRPSSPVIQRMIRMSDGQKFAIDWNTLDWEAVRKLWNNVEKKKYQCESLQEFNLLQQKYAELQPKPRTPRSTAPPVDYSGTCVSTGGKPSRRSDTDYGEDPSELARDAVSGNPVFEDMLKKHERAPMSDAFTSELVTHTSTLSDPNPFESKMLSKKPTQTMSDLGVSRNHRLADSVIGMIMRVSLMNYLQANSKQQGIMYKALDDFAKTIAPSTEATFAMAYFTSAVNAWTTNQSLVNGFIQNACNNLSVNVQNVRFGGSETNTRVLNCMDENVDSSGLATPISAAIPDAVMDLAKAGLISDDLAKQAIRSAYDKASGTKLSSSVQ